MKAIWLLTLGTCVALFAWLAPARAASYTEIDRHALAVADRDETSVERLAAALTAPARTDQEKARAIFRWIAEHIAYDEEAYSSGHYGDVSPEAVLRRRQSVCAGYARLFQALARAAGLEAALLSGHAKGTSYRLGSSSTGVNHDWNAVKLDGRWYLLDVTWGAGALMGRSWQRRFTEHYFLTPPQEFIYDHLPDDPKWQLLDPPLTQEQYGQLAYLRPAFFQHGLRVGSHPGVRVAAGDSARLTFTGPRGLQLTARLTSARGAPLSGTWTLCQRGEGTYEVLVRWPRRGDYRLTIFVKGDREKGPFWEAAEYTIDARGGTPAGFPVTTGTFAERGAILRQPTSRTLAAGRPQTFSLIVPGAKEVAVATPRRWQPLARHGEEFTGTITPLRGPVQIVADSWVLAEYEAE